MHGPHADIPLLLLLYTQPRGGREGETAIRPSQLQDEALGLRECRVFPLVRHQENNNLQLVDEASGFRLKFI